MSVVKFAITLTSEQKEVQDLVSLIRPHWESNDVIAEEILCGLNNSVWKVSNGTCRDDVIAVKIYGKECTLLDRQRELQLMEDLHDRGITLPLYARFDNGVAYKFAPGSTLSPHQLLNIDISRLVIAKMHEIHEYETDAYSFDASKAYIHALLDRWREIADKVTTTAEFRSIFDAGELSAAIANVIPDFLQLSEEVPPCFCHCDMHVRNIILDPQTGELSVIDWEQCGMYSPLLDIANHFVICPGNNVYESDINIPKHKDFIEQFIRLYLETHPDYGSQPVSQQLVNKWLHGTYRAMQMTLVIGGFWALIQWTSRQGRDYIGFAQQCERFRQSTIQMLRHGFE